MAPSTVFSYLRGQHRRGSSTSNPSSPLPLSAQHSGESPLQVPENFHPSRSPGDRSAPLDPSISPRPYHDSNWDASYNWEKLDRPSAPKRSSDSDSRSPASNARRIPSSPLNQSRPASAVSDSAKPLPTQFNASTLSLAPSHNIHLGNYNGNNGPSRSMERLHLYDGSSKGASTTSLKSPPSISSQPARTGKARLNLLNPMSLLARRRSSQILAQNELQANNLRITTSAVQAITEDYDPRIRGKVIHDFSAPRARRNYSSSDVTSPAFDGRPGYQEGRRRSDFEAVFEFESRSTEHTPVFKEHFEDDEIPSALDSPHYSPYDLPQPDREPPPLPPFARNLPAEVPRPSDNVSKKAPIVEDKLAHTLLPVVPEAESQSTSQSSSPPRVSVSESVFQSTSVPKRLASNASRFSFDMGSLGSTAQERLLEEKHKQKEAEKLAANRGSGGDYSDEGDYNYDDMDDDGGFEEKIPGINADAEEDDEDFEEMIPGINIDAGEDEAGHEDIPGNESTDQAPQVDPGYDRTSLDSRNEQGGVETPRKPGDLEAFRFTPGLRSAMTSPMSTIDPDAISQPTPRDESGNVIGFAMSKDSPDSNRSSYAQKALEASSALRFRGGLGLISLGTSQDVYERPLSPPSQVPQDEDDLYFDDGLIGDAPDDAETGGFDEAIFDDETSDLFERRKVPFNNLQERTISPDRITSGSEGEGYDFEISPVDVSNAVPQNITKAGIPRGFWATNHHAPSITAALASEPSGLTEGNLAAYHDALATAANEAAANGRFNRKESISQASDGTSQLDDCVPGLISDDSRTSRGLDSVRPFSNDNLRNDFDYDDGYDLDDDAIIAAANADALENDDEGFYGQEFGFYARSNSNCEGELVNGGYFGSRGVEGVTRSHSGRVNFREPSLTPITERSEWSTRNSVINLPTLGIPPHSAHTLPSPGLAQLQLVDMEGMDDDMTFSALMKLRRGAFGGSNGSLRSSAASQASASSPLTLFPPANVALSSHNIPSSPMAVSTHHVTGSTYSLASSTGLASASGIPEESDEEGSPASPTVTIPQSATDFAVQSPSALEASPMRKGAVRGRGHSRGSSGAESVSYVKETDADGSGRWILERRRTGESGEIEVIGREVLAGGRI